MNSEKRLSVIPTILNREIIIMKQVTGKKTYA
jgi:hypothetical protein